MVSGAHAVYVASFLVMLSQGLMITLVIPLLGAVGNESTVWTSVAVASFGAGRLVFNLPAGWVVEHYGAIPTVFAAALVTAAATAGSGVAPSAEFVIALRLVAGAANAFWMVGSMSWIAAASHSDHRARAFATLATVQGTASAIGPAIGGVLAAALGVRVPIIIAGLPLVLAAALVRLAPPTGHGGAPALLVTRGRPRRLEPALLVVLVPAAVLFATRAGMQYTLIPLEVLRQGLPLQTLGFGASLAAAAGLAVAIPASQLVDRWGPRWVVTLAVVGVALAIIAWALVPVDGFLPAMVLYGGFSTIASSSLAAAVVELPSSSALASRLSVYRFFCDAGYVLGPVALGAIAAGWSVTAAVGFNVAALIIGAAMMGFGARPSREPEELS